jgi:hypothetical protein
VTTAAQHGFKIAQGHVASLTSGVTSSAKKGAPLVEASGAAAARAKDAFVALHEAPQALDGEALRSVLSHVRSGGGAPPQNNPSPPDNPAGT